ncbi:tRNA (cytidine(34)-2'-O)-methyltransferase [Bathymodiolus thermophilus thioautotrophic gill symbiont]|jgi:tRNA (cytidine/uridine-2'-O-)-methyltransferase|uniref:tRNA (cytidine(34)-2'-O)-methyltransferase n=1 Tax=Bathymodiolus thermophilus thioautotrophic gill symbiont TaxID=2360 RepID=A0A1J5TWY1_9GAMM|nr:tRNA (cytidine(34)-2'-O)-methyltransferase [Bathymodiolus thermophilus thioautotrophic gill symbiont]OIR25266.1 RNA methyltransferase [Bathymodiolus thermophilus thioautotrophic gill symbiont]CAB5501285.1 tRNA (cytidine(34)-2'-O)-methyltransferase (EC [Bathymodiolus thermophilus thioautotrophic gill symbiont]CAB5505699.1 tRNA (cytidine(34)-2'-O)-methyltransferase (EC [Bathymodiolus thermophilus thioautotrophic gill symbiont]SGZ89500.1 tRNA (cytidine(34)-2'-O)-methyltransferase [Bathymodiolus
MLNLVLFEPEIPNNTGAIIRLCANMGANLHLIKPYGFDMEDKKLRRAGLDYKELACVREYDNFEDYLDKAKPERLFAVSSKVKTIYTEVNYQANDSLLLGPETRGLPEDILSQYQGITLPMQAGSRSLNLSNCASIVAYEAWRQIAFIGAKK